MKHLCISSVVVYSAESILCALDILRAVRRSFSELMSIRKGGPPPQQVESCVSYQGGLNQGAEDSRGKGMHVLVMPSDPKTSFSQAGASISISTKGTILCSSQGSQIGNTLCQLGLSRETKPMGYLDR